MEYKEFIRTTLPHLGLRWRRFRSKSIRRRVITRLQTLGLHSLSEYHSYLFDNEEERRQLTGLLTVTISRFWRNAHLFDALEKTWLPAVLDRLNADEPLRIWSAGCASGEEPYSLLILWEEAFSNSDRELRLLASDSDKHCLKRAQKSCYPASSFREMPLHLRKKYCTNEEGMFSLPQDFPTRIQWVEHNLIWEPPFMGKHLIFCRNLVYTYFVEQLQEKITRSFCESLVQGGLLVVGRKDRLPTRTDKLFELKEHPVYERV
jgi:chemotaxis protein methyltransferase CheR